MTKAATTVKAEPKIEAPKQDPPVKAAPGKLVNPFAQQAAAEDPKPEVKPAPKKLGQMNWVKDDDEDAKPTESKPEPKKITNTFQADVQASAVTVQRSATVKVPSSV